MNHLILNLQMVLSLKLASIVEIGLLWDHLTNLISTFSGETKVSPQALKDKFDAISNSRTNLLKKEDKLRNYLNHAFQCQPQKTENLHPNNSSATNETQGQVKLMQEEINKLILQYRICNPR